MVVFLCLNILASLNQEYSGVSACVIGEQSSKTGALMNGLIDRVEDKGKDPVQTSKNDEQLEDDSYMIYYHIRMG